MRGSTIKQKIVDKGFQLKDVADRLGMSPQNFQRVAIDNDNVKTETLERIATAIGESVSYFYNEVPILSLDDYARIHSLETENKYLRALLEEKERTIQVLLSSKQ